MTAQPANNKPKNTGDRRSGVDRRQFVYSSYIPERRFGRDRRVLENRRLNDRGLVAEGYESP